MRLGDPLMRSGSSTNEVGRSTNEVRELHLMRLGGPLMRSRPATLMRFFFQNFRMFHVLAKFAGGLGGPAASKLMRSGSSTNEVGRGGPLLMRFARSKQPLQVSFAPEPPAMTTPMCSFIAGGLAPSSSQQVKQSPMKQPAT